MHIESVNSTPLNSNTNRSNKKSILKRTNIRRAELRATAVIKDDEGTPKE